MKMLKEVKLNRDILYVLALQYHIVQFFFHFRGNEERLFECWPSSLSVEIAPQTAPTARRLFNHPITPRIC